MLHCSLTHSPNLIGRRPGSAAHYCPPSSSTSLSPPGSSVQHNGIYRCCLRERTMSELGRLHKQVKNQMSPVFLCHDIFCISSRRRCLMTGLSYLQPFESGRQSLRSSQPCCNMSLALPGKYGSARSLVGPLLDLARPKTQLREILQQSSAAICTS